MAKKKPSAVPKYIIRQLSDQISRLERTAKERAERVTELKKLRDDLLNKPERAAEFKKPVREEDQP
jgi:hypothetical protein